MDFKQLLAEFASIENSNDRNINEIDILRRVWKENKSLQLHEKNLYWRIVHDRDFLVYQVGHIYCIQCISAGSKAFRCPITTEGVNINNTKYGAVNYKIERHAESSKHVDARVYFLTLCTSANISFGNQRFVEQACEPNTSVDDDDEHIDGKSDSDADLQRNEFVLFNANSDDNECSDNDDDGLNETICENAEEKIFAEFRARSAEENRSILSRIIRCLIFLLGNGEFYTTNIKSS